MDSSTAHFDSSVLFVVLESFVVSPVGSSIEERRNRNRMNVSSPSL